MTRHRSLRAVLSAGILSMALAPTATFAADPSLQPVGITARAGEIGALVTPVPVVRTNTGDTGGQIRVDNTSGLAEDFSITVVDYVLDPNGKPVSAPPGYPFGSSGWYKFESPTFSLPGGTSREVHFDLTVPASAGAGDHFAALNVTVQASPAAQASVAAGTNVTSVIRIQNRLQHRVAGAHPETPSVGLTATTDLSGVHFAARIDNTGNTVLPYQAAPAATIDLYNSLPWGDAAAPERTLVVKGFYVAPEATRLVAVDWTDTPIIGQYRAVFTLPTTDGLAMVTAESTVTVVNWPILGLIGGVMLVLLVGGAFLVLRRPSPAERA